MPKSDLAANPLELLLREVYIHRAAGKGLARVFIREHEQIRKAAKGGNVESRFEDAVYFFAVAAATGVAGNLTYDALAALMQAIRRPKHEIAGECVKFEAVVSRTTYNSLRRQRHPGARASRNTAEIEKKLEMEYKLMVAPTRKQQNNPHSHGKKA